jgi:hypothetical protein
MRLPAELLLEPESADDELRILERFVLELLQKFINRDLLDFDVLVSIAAALSQSVGIPDLGIIKEDSFRGAPGDEKNVAISVSSPIL